MDTVPSSNSGRARLCVLPFIVCFLSAPRVAGAQSVDAEATSAGGDSSAAYLAEPVVGLVLSGGGARGFSHLGVLKVIEEVGLPVHVITGTSMGAAVGGIYASGFSADSLEKIALQTDWERIFRESLRRGYQGSARPLRDEEFIASFTLNGTKVALPEGLVSGQLLSMELFRLTMPVHDIEDFGQLPIPFAAMAVDLETGEAVRLDEGYLPMAIRASIAMPSVFTPVRIDGRLYTDGGVMRSLAAEDARAMGAELVICVDASVPLEPVDELETFVDILNQSISFHVRDRLEEQKQLCDLVITPVLDDIEILDFGKAGEAIQLGEDAAWEALPRLKALIKVAGHPAKPHRFVPVSPQSLRVREIHVEGVRPKYQRQVRTALRFEPPARLTVDDLEEAILRVHDTRLFSLVTYRVVETASGGVSLVIEPQLAQRQALGVGLRYDSDLKTVALLSASFGNQLPMGPRYEFDVRLGENFWVGAAYVKPLIPRRWIWLRGDARISWSSIELFGTDGDATSMRRIQASEAKLLVGLSLSDAAILSAGLRAEHHETGDAIGSDPLTQGPGNLVGATAQLRIGKLDQVELSSGGYQLMLSSNLLTSFSRTRLALTAFNGRFRRPMGRGISLIGRGVLAHVDGTEIPPHYRLYLGGTFAPLPYDDRQATFFGYDVQAFSGSTMQAYTLGLQFSLPRASFVRLSGNAGRMHTDHSLLRDTDGFRYGFGLELGSRTVVGPVKVALTGPDPNGPYEFAVALGYAF